jgi:hypothetical protein
VVQSRLRREVDHRHSAIVSSSNAMNRFESSAKPSSEREGDLRRLSEFHTVLLGVAGHDLHQPVQVIQKEKPVNPRCCCDCQLQVLWSANRIAKPYGTFASFGFEVASSRNISIT